jgi:hypothetical protein
MNVNVGILNQLAAYFRGESNVEALRDFMVEQYLNPASLANDDKKFLSEFEGAYAELSDQLISEAMFKQLLAAGIIASLHINSTPQAKVLGASASTGSAGSFDRSAGTCSPQLPIMSYA